MWKMLKALFGQNIHLSIWAIILLTSPFYVVDSGIPQPSDILMAAYGGFLVLSGKTSINKGLQSRIINLKRLVIYITIVNLLWYPLVMFNYKSALGVLISPMFYWFNYLGVIILFSLYTRYGIIVLKVTLYSVILGNFLQIGLSPFAKAIQLGSDDMQRGALFFNNPNQLGYHVLLSTTVFLVCLRYFKVKMYIFIPFMICSLYMASLSLSKAAVLSIVILFGIYFLTNFNMKSLWLIPAMIIILIGFANSEFGQAFIGKFQQRMDEADALPVSEWEYRGYDRMEHDPQYLILGSGEGAFERFKSYIGKHEMHSSYGTLLFAYGIPGITLFIMFLIDILRGLKMSTTAYILPILAYGMSHQGLRFTLLWVGFGVFAILAHEVKIKKLARLKKRREEQEERLLMLRQSQAQQIP